MSTEEDQNNNKSDSLTYSDAGVDITAGNELVDNIKPLLKATNRPGVMGAVGGFGGLFDLKATNYQDPLLVAANDGVGTKLKLAFETGIHDTVGIDLVAMCVNDLVVQGAEPLFFLDYFACGKLKPGIAEAVIAGIAKGCEIAGCALIGGETAEMPGMYNDEEYDLAGFSVGAVERDKLLPNQQIKAGNIIIGLASSGVHSNGFSLVRKLIEKEQLSLSDPAPFDETQKLGQALLTPTIIYVRPLLKALKEGAHINALAHITGGGLTENIPRVLPNGLSCTIDLATLSPPPVFKWLQQAGNITTTEMLRTFNLGIGMVIIAEKEQADTLITLLNNEGEQATLIGEISENAEPFNTINQLEL